MKIKKVLCLLLAVVLLLSIAAIPASAWDDYKRDLNKSYKEYWNNGKVLEYHKGSSFPFDDIWSATAYEIPTNNIMVNGQYITGKVYTRCQAIGAGVARQADSTSFNANSQRFYCSTYKVDGEKTAAEVLHSGYTNSTSHRRFDIRITQS